MWPWGHLAVAYLCYVAWTWTERSRKQDGLAIVAVGIGSQFPDLVDKPLAWTFAVLPSGRSLAHSLFTATIIIWVVVWASRRVNRRYAGIAFGIGYLSHVFSDLGPDVISGLLVGDFSQLQWTTYLVWPLLGTPPYSNDASFLAHFAAFRVDPYVSAQFLLLGFAAVVWYGSGSPGFWSAYRFARRRSRRLRR